MAPSSSSSTSSSNWFADQLQNFHKGHERVKHAVHSYWRQNTLLSPRGTFGKVFMGCLYCSLPVAFGYVVVNKIVENTESTVQDRLAGTTSDSTTTTNNNNNNWESQRIGAGGWGGGVHLAASDKDTQDVNRINLERFLKKQRRLKEKREREAAAVGQE